MKGEADVAIAIPLDEFEESALAKLQSEQQRGRFEESVRAICTSVSRDDVVWLRRPLLPDREGFKFSYLDIQDFDSLSRIGKPGGIEHSEWSAVWSAITGHGRGNIREHWIPQTYNAFLQAQKTAFPRVELIPAIRQVGPKAEGFNDYSGRGLIDKLAEIQSPGYDRRDQRTLFDKINAFLQSVTGKVSAQIEIPHHRDHILVHMDEKILPLSSLGTGIHEVIMIASFCTLSASQIMCIEEPELHLHPLLQRKLMAFLQANTSNQYFIATHSAAFIDTKDAAIFHVTNDGAQTRIRESVMRSERYAVCVDLGVRASDIVQSNAVIWVEGPSDRIYMRYWIQAVDPNLIEGIHYSVMFYGGRLLSHLSADDDEVTEFIGLKSLNRNLALVMDSDRSAEEDEINATKQRLFAEFEKGAGVAWVTAGREIENYVEHSLLQEAVKQVYLGSYSRPASGGRYDHPLHFRRFFSPEGDKRGTRLEKTIDKVKIAKGVCKSPANLDVLDLRGRIEEVVSMIRQANA